jgi:hypothetical protein
LGLLAGANYYCDPYYEYCGGYYGPYYPGYY